MHVDDVLPTADDIVSWNALGKVNMISLHFGEAMRS